MMKERPRRECLLRMLRLKSPALLVVFASGIGAVIVVVVVVLSSGFSVI